MINSFLTKFKERKTTFLLIVCFCFALLYFLSGFWKWFQIGCCILAIISFLLLPINQSFCLFLFAHSFNSSIIIYDFCFAVILISFTAIMLIKYCIGLKNKKYKFHKQLGIILSVVYISSILLSIPYKVYTGGILYLCYLPLIYFFFCMREEFNIRQGIAWMFGGLIFSSAFGMLSLLFTNYQLPAMFYERFRGLTDNPNYIYMRAIFCICYYIHLQINNKLSNLKFYLIYFSCIIITLFSFSKTGLLLLVLFSFIYFILLCTKSKNRLKHSLIFIGFLALTCLCLSPVLLVIMKRFTSITESSNGIITSLFSFRDHIWITYLKEWTSNPIIFLFGKGLFSAQPYIAIENSHRASHNLYIFLLYRFGLIGTLALVYCIYLVVKSKNKKYACFTAFLPMLWFILESMCDNTFKIYNIMYLVLAFMVLFDKSNLEKTNTSQNVIKSENTTEKIEKNEN